MNQRIENIECPQCGTTFEHDANFEDAYCPECGDMIEVEGN